MAAVLAVNSAALDSSEDDRTTSNSCVSSFVAQARGLQSRHEIAVTTESSATPSVLKVLAQYDQEIRSIIRGAMQTCSLKHADEALRPIVLVMQKVDSVNLDVFRKILETNGWPSSRAWGSEVADAAFLIVQHADQAPAFQEQGLALLEKLVAKGEAPADEFALLFDRIRINAKKPQRYGTQGNCKGKAWIAAPLEDFDQVDKLRAAVGLPPLAEYANVASQLGCQR